MALTRRDFLTASLALGAAAACGLFGDDRGERVAYGRAPSQFGELWLPSGDPRATVVLVHGGAWQERVDLTLVEPMARDLRDRGYAVWNVEYRRVGEPGGGWPGTFADVGAAVDHLAVLALDHPVDPGRAVVVGHSAGGTLALWDAGRQGRVQPLGHLALAGITDLEACVDEDPLAGACAQVLGGTPEAAAARYRRASPLARLPTGRRQGLVHGADDIVVPVGQSTGYALAAETAGDEVALDVVPNAGHFQLIDPSHPAYQDQVLGQLTTLTRSSPS